jgi:tyrosyl-tRNA synthetase
VPSAPATLETCACKPVFAVAAAAGMFKSNGEARRMAAQGGLSLNDAKIDEKRLFSADDVRDGVAVLRSGKKNYFVLRFENP